MTTTRSHIYISDKRANAALDVVENKAAYISELVRDMQSQTMDAIYLVGRCRLPRQVAHVCLAMAGRISSGIITPDALDVALQVHGERVDGEQWSDATQRHIVDNAALSNAVTILAKEIGRGNKAARKAIRAIAERQDNG